MTNSYGEEMLEVSIDSFKRNKFEVATSGKEFEIVVEDSSADAKKQLTSVYVVPAPFCACQFINDLRHSRRDDDWENPITEV